mgnify:CR=1 FL=1
MLAQDSLGAFFLFFAHNNRTPCSVVWLVCPERAAECGGALLVRTTRVYTPGVARHFDDTISVWGGGRGVRATDEEKKPIRTKAKQKKKAAPSKSRVSKAMWSASTRTRLDRLSFPDSKNGQPIMIVFYHVKIHTV